MGLMRKPFLNPKGQIVLSGKLAPHNTGETIDKQKHGTRNAYNTGCRCNDCLTANREYRTLHK